MGDLGDRNRGALRHQSHHIALEFEVVVLEHGDGTRLRCHASHVGLRRTVDRDIEQGSLTRHAVARSADVRDGRPGPEGVGRPCGESLEQFSGIAAPRRVGSFERGGLVGHLVFSL